MAAQTTAPLVVGFCPDSPATKLNHRAQTLFARIESELGAIPGLWLLRPSDFALYYLDDYYDPRRDQLGHIPYTPTFFAALGTILARKIHALLCPPHKVIVLDCDNTVWKGVVGEEGVAGIADPACVFGTSAVDGRSGRQRIRRLPVQQKRRVRRARGL